VTKDLNAVLMGKRKAREAELPATAPARAPLARPVSPAGDRWQALNQFVDLIAPRLSLAERAVWLVLYRHARDGVVDVSSRGLATAARVNKATASRALRTFEAVGIVWPIWKSTDRSKGSQYGLHPRPSECLAKVLEFVGDRTA